MAQVLPDAISPGDEPGIGGGDGSVDGGVLVEEFFVVPSKLHLTAVALSNVLSSTPTPKVA